MKEILTLIYIFLLNKIAISGSAEELISFFSKYYNFKYINAYKISNNIMSFYSNGGEK